MQMAKHIGSHHHNQRPRIWLLVLCIGATLCIGFAGGIATMSNIYGWYENLQKPSFNPPNYIFGPVWTVLYILMGISFYMILQSQKSKGRNFAIGIFAIQLFLNFWWSYLFFSFHWLGASFIEILILWICVLLMIISFYRLNKTASLIQLPYLLWISFASVLNGTIWMIN